MIRTIIVTLTILVVACLVALAIAGAALGVYPWWLAAAMIGGAAGLVLGVVALRRFIVRRRERSFVERVIQQDEAAIAKAPAEQEGRLRNLQSTWREAVEMLRRSKLRQKGNPLYVLPWYLVIGESAAGKTSSIRHANLHSPLTEVSSAGGIAATRNCDWWFYEEAIILDTAGRYSIPLDGEKDVEEWHRFLSLVSRYRKREPLNGIVVAVPADKLVKPDETALQELGDTLRKRIDQTMRALAAKTPVYVLVTKMDMVQGMEEFCGHLGRELTSQVMGFVNDEVRPYSSRLLRDGLAGVVQRLRDLRLVLVHKNEELEPDVFLFPREVERLGAGLEIFLGSLFNQNSYQETPLYRGVYFSSALQEEVTRGGAPDQVEEADAQVRAKRGTFLTDFYGTVLPRDRRLNWPIPDFRIWERRTTQIALGAWGLLWVFLIALTFASFVKNQAVLKLVRPGSLPGREEGLDGLDRVRLLNRQVEKANRGWFIPRMGLRHSRRLERRLKKGYVVRLSSRYQKPFDEHIHGHIRHLKARTPDKEMVGYIEYFVDRIGIVKDRLERKPADETYGLAQAAVVAWGEALDETSRTEMRLLSHMYADYLRWNTDEEMVQRSLRRMLGSFAQIIDLKGESLRWCVAPAIHRVDPLALHDFWEGAPEHENSEELAGAYTGEGRANIARFFEQVEATIQEEGKIERFRRREKAFWEWYGKQFFLNWHEFFRHCDETMLQELTRAQWREINAAILQKRGPYSALLSRAAREFGSYDGDTPQPEWARLVTEIARVEEELEKQRKETRRSVAGKIAQTADNLMKKGKEALDSAEAARQALREQVAPDWGAYWDNIGDVAEQFSSPDRCFEIVSEAYPSFEESTEETALTEAYTGLAKIRRRLSPEQSDGAVWYVVEGPLRVLTIFGVREAACRLQQRWELDVLAKVAGAPRSKRDEVLFDDSEGVVWEFANETMAPFAVRTTNGYGAVKSEDYPVPFKPRLFRFLNAAAEGVLTHQPEYVVTLEAMPIQVNPGAIDEPYESVVSVQCADGPVYLENQNYPRSLTFKWHPDRCGDVSVRIMFSRLVLTKFYSGELGLAHFLRDFRDGTHTYAVEDFPRYKEHLSNRGIEWIRLTYRVEGAEPVIQLLKTMPGDMPREIVECWEEQVTQVAEGS